MDTPEEKQIIGSEFSSEGAEKFFSVNPLTGIDNQTAFTKATTDEVNRAAEKALAAFQIFRKTAGAAKADFLEAIATEIMNSGEELVTVCMNETALPKPRIENERGRTVNQLKMFAALLREGSWVDARIETALPDRTPIPKPDIRYMLVAIGPVLVFGSSNFPLAFSVAGGDTASALAAGCPVIVKAHPAHPGTSAIVGKAIQRAAIKSGMPDGVFSLLYDNGHEVGMQLVRHPSIRAIGFTGSFRGGKAIYDAAARRSEPIPVFAEMGSTNPVFILPEALKQKSKSIAEAFAASVTLGVGQFCTNPGLLFYHGEANGFRNDLKEKFEQAAGGVMLTAGIANSFTQHTNRFLGGKGIAALARGVPPGTRINTAVPLLMEADHDEFVKNESLTEEIFGPSSVVVNVPSRDAMLKIATGLGGHLTATIFGTDNELTQYEDLVAILEQKVGRLIINNMPTGVEVCSAMVHGGPFPATTDSRSTSVGTAAILRFARPVCYQNVPEGLLPPELKNSNPLKIIRQVNGEKTDRLISQASFIQSK